MKCPKCGYHNLPGIAVCGQCQRAESSQTPNSITRAPLDFAPPRARDRDTVTAVREQFHRPIQALAERTRPLRAQTVRSGFVQSGFYGLDYAALPILFVAVFPGLGHVLQKRHRTAAVIAVFFATLLLTILITLRNPVSNSLLLLAVLVIGYSVFDVSGAYFPSLGHWKLDSSRILRRVLVSIGVLATTVFLGSALLNQWYMMTFVTTDSAAPLLKSGDGIIAERITNPVRQLHIGDIVLTRQNYGEPAIMGRVAHLPRTNTETLSLLVLATPLYGREYPQTNTANMTTSRNIIDMNSNKIESRIIARFSPAARRAWMTNKD